MKGQSDSKGITGNRGEWSELYAFFRLLGDHCLFPCDADLNEKHDYAPDIVEIHRGANEKLVYRYTGDGRWEIYTSGEKKGTVSSEESASEADRLLACIQSGDCVGGFSVEGALKFLERLADDKIKAKSGDKQDIVLKVHDLRAGGVPVKCGFSIKSYLGSAPTLQNASADCTNILYAVRGISVEKARLINDECDKFPKKRIRKLMSLLKEHGASIEFEKICHRNFESNLIVVADSMPKLLGELLLVHYLSGESSVREVTEMTAARNPLQYPQGKSLYERRVKKLLEAFALGMTPAGDWRGEENANGGFIVVRWDGKLLTYHLFNRTELDEYLYRYTKFDHPSSGKHKYGRLLINEADGSISLKLALQIRFITPRKDGQPHSRTKTS